MEIWKALDFAARNNPNGQMRRLISFIEVKAKTKIWDTWALSNVVAEIQHYPELEKQAMMFWVKYKQRKAQIPKKKKIVPPKNLLLFK